MNNFTKFIVLSGIAITIGCATPKQKYIQSLQIHSTQPICQKMNDMFSSCGITVSDNFAVQNQKLQNCSNAKRVTRDYAKSRKVFCELYQYYFIDDGNFGEPCERGNCTRHLWFGNEKAVDTLNINYTPEPVRYLSVDEEFLEDLEEMKTKIQSQVKTAADVDINQVYSSSKVISYPSMTGMAKVEAKKRRKEFLDSQVKEVFGSIDSMVKNSKSVRGFLASYIPINQGQEKLDFALSSIKDEAKKYGVVCQVECELHPYHIYYDFLNDHKEKYLSKVVLDNDMRYDVYAYLIKAFTKLDIKRLDRERVEIKVTIDFPKAHKFFKFQKLSDLIEQ